MPLVQNERWESNAVGRKNEMSGGDGNDGPWAINELLIGQNVPFRAIFVRKSPLKRALIHIKSC